MIEAPKKFVGLHSHSTFSVGDAIGTPKDHIDFALSNGMDALALTDHGNMAGYSHQQVYADKLKKKGVTFKALAGVEAYFIPSLVKWREDYAVAKANGTLKPSAKKKATAEDIGNELVSTEQELSSIKDDSDEDEEGGTIVENEEESKSNKHANPLRQRSHLVLLAKNDAGLKSLFNIVSDSSIDGYYNVPRIDFDILAKHAKGNIVASSACVAGQLARIIFNNQDQNVDWKDWLPNQHNFDKIQSELASIIGRFQEVLGPENYYLEIQANKLGAQALVNMHLIEASKRTGAKLVATCDAHYSNPKHWKEREIYKALSWHGATKEPLPERVEDLKCELYPKNAQQLWDTFETTMGKYDFYDPQLIKDAIERTYDIAHNQIDKEVKADRSVKLPAITTLIPVDEIERIKKLLGEEGKDTDEESIAFRELKDLAVKGLKWRKTTSQVYIDRLKEELSVVKHLKLSKYFLTYYHIMKAVNQQLLTGPGRGSAAGSLLAYVLDITQVDSVKHGCLFERFLNRFKAGMADIDSDFSDRDAAVKLISEYFGEENVIPVSNFAQLQLASLCKDLAKLFDVPFELVNSYTYKMRSEAMAVAKQRPGFDAQVWDFTLEVAEQDSPSFNEFMKEMEQYPDFYNALTVLFKQMRTISKHAGGVLLTANAREAMPLLKAKGGIQTPWPEGLANRHLEDFGLLKFDILGLGTLRMFEDCIRKILKAQGNKAPSFAEIKTWYNAHLHPDNNGMDDMKVYKNVFWQGRYAGIFQFVQKNTQTFMAQMKPTCLYDIAIATSIFRPGPLAAGVDKAFLNNRMNPESVVYKHPLLKEVYANTSGLLVFQEQLQMTYHKLAGVPLEQTDGVRKAFTKKDMSNKEKAAKDRFNLRKDFEDKCLSVNGISPSISGELFDEMEKLVAYSFNLSHAISYGMITYMCAYLLTYYPDEWISTYIDYCTTEKGSVAGKEDPKVIAIQEAKQLGYSLCKPDINISEYEFVNDPSNKKNLIPSMASLKYVGKSALWEIKQNRPYKSVVDLLVNPDNTWRHSRFNKRSLETLIKLEALDSMNIVGLDKDFRTYKELYDIVVVGYDKLKSTANKKKNNDVKLFLKEKIAEYRAKNPEPCDWSTKDKIEFSSELAGSVDMNLILPESVQEQLHNMKIKSIDDWSGKGSYWAIVSEAKMAVTKTGKPYLRMKLFAESSEQYTCFVWSYRKRTNPDDEIKQYDVIAGIFDKSNFGLSAFAGQFYKLNEQAR